MVRLTLRQRQKEKQKRKEQLRKLYFKKKNLEKQGKVIKTKIERIDDRIIKIQQKIGATERTVIISVRFSCRFSDDVWEEPQPLIHEATMIAEEGFRIKSLAVWRDFMVDSKEVRETIEELCNDKCDKVSKGGVLEEITDSEVIAWYEE